MVAFGLCCARVHCKGYNNLYVGRRMKTRETNKQKLEIWN